MLMYFFSGKNVFFNREKLIKMTSKELFEFKAGFSGG